MTSPRAVLYRERQPMKRLVVGVMLAAIGFTIVLLISLFIIHLGLPAWPKLVLAGIIVVLIGVTLTFRQLSIVVTDADISFGFGLLRTRVPWREVRSVKAEPYLFTRFVGWGIRWDLRDTFAFIAQSGMGIELQTKRRWRFFITTDKPQKLVELSQARIRQFQ